MKKQLTILLFAILFVALTVTFVSAQSTINLRTAGDFVILAKSGISTTGTTSIEGDIGVSPIDSTAITGFGLIKDSSNQFATSSLIIGSAYAADYTSPTPSVMTTAISDMETAYTNAAGRTETNIVTELGAGSIGGMTLTPGLYKWGTGLLISTDVTLSGSSNDVWIFQIEGTLNTASSTQVILSGGAQSKNIFWQVKGQTTLGTYSTFNGNILCKTAIVLNTGATLRGRALAQTAVTLDANHILLPASVVVNVNDITPPGITIFGASPIFVNQYAPYIDEGAAAFDDTDGDVAVTFSGIVNTSIIGGTRIMYTATDTAGNTATAYRTIWVVSAIPVLTTITFSPKSASLIVGYTQQLNATGFDQFSLPIAVNISYSSSNLSVATIDASSGVVTAVAPGNTTISASSGAIISYLIVNVSSSPPLPPGFTIPVLTTIMVSPKSANITIGSTLQLNAKGFNQYGAPIAATINYTSDNDSIARVSSLGLVSAVTSGNVIITMASGNVSERVTIKIYSVPITFYFNPGVLWINSNFNITLTATEIGGLGIAHINYILNGVSGRINGSFGNILINENRNNTLEYSAVDLAGNSETKRTLYALLDKIAPNITSFTLSATSAAIGSLITGNCTATDNLDSNLNVNITGIDTSTAGTKTATCLVRDRAGNNATAIATYTINSAPSAEITSNDRGGSSSSSSSCITQWNCSEWSACTNGVQTRNCSYPAIMCKPTAEKPAESQMCLINLEAETTNPNLETLAYGNGTSNSEIANVPPSENNSFFKGITSAVISPFTNPSLLSTIIVILVILSLLGVLLVYLRLHPK